MDAFSTINLLSGNAMPIIGLGTWKLDNVADAIVSAVKSGYRMIDTSGDYGTQPGIAAGLKRCGIPRSELFIVSKVEETDDAYEATKKNLTELQLDNADLMLIHRPPDTGVGNELWQGLIRAREEGLTRDIGVSNYSVEQMEELIEASGVAPVVNQIEWSPFGYSQEMFDFCRGQGIVIQAYSPLTRSDMLDDDVLQSIATAHGKAPAQVLIRWNLQFGTVPLPKASKPEHQRENIDVFDFELTDTEMDILMDLNSQYSALGRKPVYV